MKRALAIALLTLFLSSFYLFIGPKVAPDGLVFLGRHNLNSQDTYTYLSFIEQARHGDLLFKNLYTSEPQPAIFFRPVYLITGWLANILNLSNISAFHLMRIILGAVFLLATWKFLGLFFEEVKNRPIAFILICLSSGLAMGFWIPEANTFLSLTDSPHFIFSQLLIMTTFWFFLTSLRQRRLWLCFAAGLAMLVLSFDHPFDPPIIILALIFYAGTLALRDLKIDWGLIFKITLVAIPGLVGLGFYFWTMKTYPAILTWGVQNNLPSPAFYYYLLGYGLLLPLAILGIKQAFAEGESKGLLLLAWVFASAVLLYSPFNSQRRFSNGLHIPIAILAAYGLPIVLKTITNYFRQLGWNLKLVETIFIILAISILFASNGYSVYQDWQVFKSDKTDYYYYYLPKTELEAINWLKENTPQDSVIGSNWFYGNLIPGLTGRRIFLGHQIQTINPEQKVKEIESFVNLDTETQARQFLRKWNVNYLFFGVGDSLLRGNFKPGEKKYLQEVYNRDGDKIYKVLND